MRGSSWFAAVAALVAAAAVAAAAGDAPTAPFGVHLAFGNATGSSMTVVWMTLNATAQSLVVWRAAGSAQPHKALGAQASYTPGAWAHAAAMDGLSPGAAYEYSVGDGALMSAAFAFTMPAADAPLRVAVYGDMGVSNSNGTLAALAARHAATPFAFVAHIGDYAYADDRKVANFEDTWNLFLRQTEPLAASLAYMTLPGNHEAACHAYGAFFCPPELDGFAPYRHRYLMPGGSVGRSPMWFSYRVGSVHFAHINTETNWGPHSPEGPGTFWNVPDFPGDQLAWLEADLAAARAAPGVRWVVVFGHRPLYSSAAFDFPLGVVEQTREVFEPIFDRHNVSLYISGHVHAYERFWVVRNGTVLQRHYDRPQAPVQLIHGCAGNLEGHSTHWVEPDPPFVALKDDATFGFGELLVHNATHLTWSFVSGADGRTVDEITITQ